MTSEKNKEDYIIIKSLSECIALVNQLYDKLKVNSFYEEERLFFRGQKSKEYFLLPSIARTTRKSQQSEHFIMQEHKMVNEFIRRKPNDFAGLDEFNTLAKMQHYGLPTRLLDITSNALVALFFACERTIENREFQDGEVFFFKKSDTEVHSSYSVHVALLSSFYRSQTNNYIATKNFDVDERLETLLGERKEDVLQDEMKEYILTVPKYHDEREIRQSAGFILYPNIVERGFITPHIRDIKDEVIKKMRFRIIIDAKSKDRIQKELSRVGITKEFLFPDMQNLAKHIYDCAADISIKE